MTARAIITGACGALLVASGWLLGAAVVGAAPPAQDGARDADALIARLTDDVPDRDEDALLAGAFDAFVERMDAFDGDRAVALGRAVFERTPAVWSAFCLEGGLRRSAPADLGSPAARAAHAEANTALEGLLAAGLGAPDRLAVVQRLALLHAGFQRPAAERRALGAALGAGGFDGLQIMALKGLSRAEGASAWSCASPETAGALFASLLDRGSGAQAAPAGADPPAGGPPEDAPWALRGHGLAALERALR